MLRRNWNRALRISVIAIASATTLLSCNAILGIEAPERAVVSDASPETSDVVTPEVEVNPCTTTGLPDPPTVGGEDRIVVLTAIRSLTFTRQEGKSLGFNLDKTCTCPGLPSCKGKDIRCDDPGGRDTSLNDLGKVFSTFPGFDEKALNAQLIKGSFGLLIRMSGWNGLPNDSQVKLEVFVSVGTGLTPPTFTASDRWDLDEDSTALTSTGDYIAPSFDNTAYIRDGLLVAKLDTLRIPFGSGTSAVILDFAQTLFSARVTDAPPVISDAGPVDVSEFDAPTADGATDTLGGVSDAKADVKLDTKPDSSADSGATDVSDTRLDTSVPSDVGIAPSPRHYLTDVMLGARWPTRGALKALAALPDPFSPVPDKYICQNSDLMKVVVNSICNSVDVVSNPTRDNTDLACDAVSFAVRYETAPARFGALRPRSTPIPSCPIPVDDCP